MYRTNHLRMGPLMSITEDQINKALSGKEVVIDITTTGRSSGVPTRIEIWSHMIDGRLIITGTPGPRNWLANLAADPIFTFHIKGDLEADLPASGTILIPKS